MARPNGGRLSRRVLQKLGRRIVSRPSDRVEPLAGVPELARQYGVSRTVLREVVKIMTNKGMVDSRPRVGVLIQAEQNWDLFDTDVLQWLTNAPPSWPIFRDLAHFRLAVEPHAAALAAVAATGGKKWAIQEATRKILAAERSSDSSVDDQIGLHKSILLASGNAFYARLIDLVGLSWRCRAPVFNAQEKLGALYLNLCDAILTADADLARRGMQAVLQVLVEREDEALSGVQRALSRH